MPDAIALRKEVGDGTVRAVVLGGGFIGLEAAEALRNQGLDVDVVELSPHILPPLETEMASLVSAEMVRGGHHHLRGRRSRGSDSRR